MKELSDLSLHETLAMSMELWERHSDTWSPMDAPDARNSLLWLMTELGEVIDIVKKHGEKRIMGDAAIRAHMIEELCDVHMYFNDILNRYGVTAAELAVAYRAKHRKNMNRDWAAELETQRARLRELI